MATIEPIPTKPIEVPQLAHELELHLPSGSQSAKQEQKDLFGKDALRSEEIKSTLHSGLLMGIQIVALAAVAMFAVRVLHFILPLSWHWLGPEQLRSIESFLMSGAFGALISRYIDKSLVKKTSRLEGLDR